MKMNIEVEVQPFPVPKYVEQKAVVRSRSDGFVENPRFPLSYVDSDTLAYMCRELVKQIFFNSGKPIPASVRTFITSGDDMKHLEVPDVPSPLVYLYPTDKKGCVLPTVSSSEQTLSDNDTRY